MKTTFQKALFASAALLTLGATFTASAAEKNCDELVAGDIQIVGFSPGVLADGAAPEDVAGERGFIVLRNMTADDIVLQNDENLAGYCAVSFANATGTVTEAQLKARGLNAADGNLWATGADYVIAIDQRYSGAAGFGSSSAVNGVLGLTSNADALHPASGAIKIHAGEDASAPVIASVSYGESDDEASSPTITMPSSLVVFAANERVIEHYNQRGDFWTAGDAYDDEDPAVYPWAVFAFDTPVCGDGLAHDDTTAEGFCDDGNNVDGDGCSSICLVETGFTCDHSGDDSLCATECGDGIVAGDEACDDGNTDSGDGCSDTCVVEAGFTCEEETATSPSVCTEDEDETPGEEPVCGNGKIEAPEACDDGNTVDGDGCSATCTIEAGYGCTGEPSTCTRVDSPAVCGNGVVEAGEECDGQTGCTDTCAWEIVTTGGKIGSCAAASSTGIGGAALALAMGLGLVALRRRDEDA